MLGVIIYTLPSVDVLIAMVNPEVEELLKDAENLYQKALKDLKARRIRKAAMIGAAQSSRPKMGDISLQA